MKDDFGQRAGRARRKDSMFREVEVGTLGLTSLVEKHSWWVLKTLGIVVDFHGLDNDLTRLRGDEWQTTREVFILHPFLRGLLNRPHTGWTDHSQYVMCQLGSNLSSKLSKFISFNTKPISCSSSCVLWYYKFFDKLCDHVARLYDHSDKLRCQFNNSRFSMKLSYILGW